MIHIAEFAEPVPQAKQALSEDEVSQFAKAVSSINTDQLRQSALQKILAVTAMGAGLGAGYRGLAGLGQAVSGDDEPLHVGRGPSTFGVPFPVKPSKQDEKKLPIKFADFAKAADPVTEGGLPWYYPGLLMGSAGGLYGGYKAMDNFFTGQKRQEVKNKLEKAKQEFNEATLSLYNKPVGTAEVKAGAVDDGFADDLEVLYQAYQEKRAFLGMSDETSGRLAGLYGAYAIPSALIAGNLFYRNVAKKRRQALMQRAIEERQKRMFKQNPPELFAIPTPVEHTPKGVGSFDAAGLDVSPTETGLPKAASLGDEFRRVLDHGKQFAALAKNYSASGPPKDLGGRPEYQGERRTAREQGMTLLQSLAKSEGFRPFASRIKSLKDPVKPLPNDFLGLKVESKSNDYGPKAVEALRPELSRLGIDVESIKRIVTNGYHGTNIKGRLKHTPVEVQLTPSSLHGLNAMHHDAVYKETMGLGQETRDKIKKLIPKAMDKVSPMKDMKSEVLLKAPAQELLGERH